jgi:8-oxo-dGTP pyrophosphatase MutT (NUDIX family)
MTFAATTPSYTAPARPGKPRASAVVWRPRAGVPEFLVVECSGRAGRFTLPGGKIDPGETPTQAALRETREEAGVQAFAQRNLGSYPHRKHGGRTHPTTVFLARYAVDTAADEDRERRWVTAEEARTLGIKIRHDALSMIDLAAWYLTHHRQAA